MPELPEVEVTRRIVSPMLLGRVVASVRTTKPSLFFLTPPRELSQRLTGRQVTLLERRGKYLVAVLDDASRLLLHLGMTGQLFSSEAVSPRLLRRTRGGALSPEAQARFAPDLHTHLALAFADGGRELYFRDVRKFGKVRWLAPGASDPRLDKLGPDALTLEARWLTRVAAGRRVAIKTLLLDQSVIAGIGNIYADEALFRARVHPERPASTLTPGEATALARAVRAVLRRSIETGGSSIDDYVHPDGQDGGYQDERRVYGLEGAPCRSCKRPIERVVLGGRSSFHCPRCQR